MSGGQRHQIDEVKTGRAIWLDTNHRRKIVTLSKGTSACALSEKCVRNHEKTTPSTLTRPTSLEMLLTGVAVEKLFPAKFAKIKSRQDAYKRRSRFS